MVTYKIETQSDPLSDLWVIVAVLGNCLTWEVGRYRSKERAEERLMRLEQMMKANALDDLARS